MLERPNFAVIGVAGHAAPRHLRAIRDVGGRLIAAADPNDSVGILDQYSFDTRFFTQTERLDRHLEKLRHGPAGERLHYLSVCSPNHLHDAHCRLGLRIGADVICEKPLVINPWNLDGLEHVERETNRRVYTVLQLRLHPRLTELRSMLAKDDRAMHDVKITYVTPRGPWYDVSWKSSLEKSGGVPTNIGIHLFDFVLWLFGPVCGIRVQLAEPRRCGGVLHLTRANVRWFLSTHREDLALTPSPQSSSPFRSIVVDGKEFDLSQGFADLHTRVYENVLRGAGFGISDVRPSLELVYRIRTAKVDDDLSDAHDVVHSLRGPL